MAHRIIQTVNKIKSVPPRVLRRIKLYYLGLNWKRESEASLWIVGPVMNQTVMCFKRDIC